VDFNFLEEEKMLTPQQVWQHQRQNQQHLRQHQRHQQVADQAALQDRHLHLVHPVHRVQVLDIPKDQVKVETGKKEHSAQILVVNNEI
jgi:hypothetical protein